MSTASLTDTQGILALAALALGIVALLACILLMRALRRVRAAQKLVLGEGSERDIVAHSASLQEAFQALQDYVGDVAAGLNDRLEGVEVTLTGAISHQALVRYDAYNELSGKQSVSIALLDDRRCGVVLTCIHHRDQARVYAKQMVEGQAELELSPEEIEAVGIALGERAAVSNAPPARARAVGAADTTTDAAGA
jgi:hypothetical protein